MCGHMQHPLHDVPRMGGVNFADSPDTGHNPLQREKYQ